MIIQGASSFKVSELKGNRVEIIIQCDSKQIAEELYDSLNNAAKEGTIQLKFHVEPKSLK